MPCPSALTKLFSSQTELFLSRTKSRLSHAKKFIFAWEQDREGLFSCGKFFSMAKKSFLIHFTSKYVLFQLRTKFLSGTKKDFVWDKKYFVWDKNDFVQAEGWGISTLTWVPWVWYVILHLALVKMACFIINMQVTLWFIMSHLLTMKKMIASFQVNSNLHLLCHLHTKWPK